MNLLVSQNFEGVLRYDMKFEIKEGDIIAAKPFRNLKESDSAVVVYTNGDSFLRYNYSPKLINIYDSKTDLIYGIEKGDKYVMTTNPKFGSSKINGKLKVKRSDSIFRINNIDCNKATFDLSYYKVTIYYSKDEKFNGMGKLFFYSSLIDFNIRNSFVTDPLIVRYIQEFDNVSTVVTLVEFESMEINSEIFTVPNLKKSKKYDYNENDRFQIYKIKDKAYRFPDLSKIGITKNQN